MCLVANEQIARRVTHHMQVEARTISKASKMLQFRAGIDFAILRCRWLSYALLLLK